MATQTESVSLKYPCPQFKQSLSDEINFDASGRRSQKLSARVCTFLLELTRMTQTG